jgi:hypothetical protein
MMRALVITPTTFTHGRLWKMVIRRHNGLRNYTAELGPPSVEGSYADHDIWKTEPGLYAFSPKNNNRLAPNGHSTPATTKKKNKKGHYYRKGQQQKNYIVQHELDNHYSQQLNVRMPLYLVEELDLLDTKEFEIAFDY